MSKNNKLPIYLQPDYKRNMPAMWSVSDFCSYLQCFNEARPKTTKYSRLFERTEPTPCKPSRMRRAEFDTSHYFKEDDRHYYLTLPLEKSDSGNLVPITTMRDEFSMIEKRHAEAEIYETKGNYQKALELHQANFEHYMNHAEAYYQLHQTIFEKSHERHDKFVPLVLGSIYNMAIPHLDKIITIHKQQSHNEQAMHSLRKKALLLDFTPGRHNEAVATYAEAMEQMNILIARAQEQFHPLQMQHIANLMIDKATLLSNMGGSEEEIGKIMKEAGSLTLGNALEDRISLGKYSDKETKHTAANRPSLDPNLTFAGQIVASRRNSNSTESDSPSTPDSLSSTTGLINRKAMGWKRS